MELAKKIHAQKAEIGVIGLGYVGLPLALTAAEAGFSVTGFDIDIFGSLQFLAELGEKRSNIFHGHLIKLSIL